MSNLEKIYLYRITHIENIQHIIQHGLTHVKSKNANPEYKTIGDRSLISTREKFILKNGKKLSDYIPFYFGYRMPMLYVIQKGFNMVDTVSAEQIVYCVTSVQKIIDENLDFIFTDGHAVDKFSTQYSSDEIAKIESEIDFEAVKATFWKSETDLDFKRRKESEFLILGDISVNSILGFLVSSEKTKLKMVALGVDEAKVHVRPNYYF